MAAESPKSVTAHRSPSVRFRLIGTRALALAALMLPGAAQAAAPMQSTIGRTWPVIEPDALSEIEAKVSSLPPDLSKSFGPREHWSALKAATLPGASVSRTRTVVPFYTLDFDIKLPDGRTLYPKGFTFNPLSFVTLPQRLVIVHPADLAWALSIAQPADFILLAANGRESGDPIALGERARRPIYILEDRVKERLGLRAAPVVVAQQGQKLLLTEFGPNARPRSFAGTGAAR